MSGILTILFLFLMFLGMPVAFAIGISAVMFYIFGPVPPEIAIQKITTATQSFPLLAVPLFVFAGHLMNVFRQQICILLHFFVIFRIDDGSTVI